MKKRKFLKIASAVTAGAIIAPSLACKSGVSAQSQHSDDHGILMPVNNLFELPPLPYAVEALKPYIDPLTMGIHHGKHHAGYVKKLNAALEKSPLAGKSLEYILAHITPDDTALRNNGGGHYNHSLFWTIMKPGPVEEPTGKIAKAIAAAFGDYKNFVVEFSKAASSQFGSGWAWLCKDANNDLFIINTPNQDNPLMTNIVTEKLGTPILGIDVWEHAYYIQYQNKRSEYIANFFQVVNWKEVERRFEKS